MEEREIFDLVSALGILNELIIEDACPPEGQVVLSGKQDICNHELTFKIEFSDNFPNEAPRVLVKNFKELSLLPHVDNKGEVCFMDRSTAVVNPSNPGGIIRESFTRAVEELKKGFKGENRADVFHEFEAYYPFFPNAIVADSIVWETGKARILKLATNKGHCCLGVSKKQIEDFSRRANTPIQNQSEYSKVLYIPLEREMINKIPLPSWDSFWTLSQVREIYFKGVGANRRFCNSALRNNKTMSIVFGMEADNNMTIQFGICFSRGNKGGHPILNPKSNGNLTPLHIERMDKDYLVNRGGAYRGLSDKKVAIIGCGAVGGAIALKMASSGLMNLTLIDHDFYSKDNCYRHELGFETKFGIPKVDGLKAKIESKLPLTRVNAIASRIETIINDGSFDVSQFDLIVVATGIPNVNFSINEHIIRYNQSPPTIYAWLDPYGIGGHTLVTNNNGKPGCYKCLYGHGNNNGGLYNSASFAEKGQSFSKSMGGCGSRFTPYSSLDADSTAIQAVRASIEVLVGGEKGNPILSWKGDDKLFKVGGYKISPRYEQNSEELFEQRYAYKDKQCQICGNNAACLQVTKRKAA